MTEKQNQEIEDLFQKAFKALDEKIKEKNSQNDPRIYLDALTEILLAQQELEWEAAHK